MWFASLRSPGAERGQHYSKLILRWSLGIIFVMAVTHLTLQYLNLEVYNEKNGAIFELSNRFDFDDESSVMSWWSQFQFLLFAAVCFLAALLEKQRVLKKLWLVPAALGLLCSIDEIATLHEYSLQRIHVAFFHDAKPTLLDNSWVIVLPFVLLSAVLLARVMFKHLPRRTIALLCVSGAIFISGAVIVDLIDSVVPESPFVSQGIFVAIEESLELLGVSMAIYAVGSYVEQHYGHKLGKAIKQLKN